MFGQPLLKPDLVLKLEKMYSVRVRMSAPTCWVFSSIPLIPRPMNCLYLQVHKYVFPYKMTFSLFRVTLGNLHFAIMYVLHHAKGSGMKATNINSLSV